MIITINIIFQRRTIIVILITGLLLTPLFSSETKGDVSTGQTNESMYVDPSLVLTKQFIPLLKTAFSHCQNPIFTTLLSEIIMQLEQNEQVNATDLKRMMNELSICPMNIYFLKPIIGHSSGKFFCFPGFLIAVLFGLDWSDMDKIVIPYIGPSFFLIGKGSIEVLRIFRNEDGNQYLSIGFFGYITSGQYEHYSEIIFLGMSLLTFVIP